MAHCSHNCPLPETSQKDASGMNPQETSSQNQADGSKNLCIVWILRGRQEPNPEDITDVLFMENTGQCQK